MRALALGAVEVIAKPGSAFSVPAVAAELVRAVRTAARARVVRRVDPPSAPAQPSTSTVSLATAGPLRADAAYGLLAIGASTGGTQAIERVLTALPADAPGTIITQHMPAQFTGAFAQRLDGICPMQVREARDGDAVHPGVALVAPGGVHMVLQRSGGRHVVRLKDGPPVHHQRPSVDVLFQSVARHAGANAVGVLLTGMGADGARGLLDMRLAGAATIAQDEASSVVFGMPKEAIRLGAAAEVVGLDAMPRAILGAFTRMEGERLAAAG